MYRIYCNDDTNYSNVWRFHMLFTRTLYFPDFLHFQTDHDPKVNCPCSTITCKKNEFALLLLFMLMTVRSIFQLLEYDNNNELITTDCL